MAQVKLDKMQVHNHVMYYHLAVFENQDEEEVEFEELETYFRLYVLMHLAASSLSKAFYNLENLFCAKNIYKQILYHKSYARYRSKVQSLSESPNLEQEDK